MLWLTLVVSTALGAPLQDAPGSVARVEATTVALHPALERTLTHFEIGAETFQGTQRTPRRGTATSTPAGWVTSHHVVSGSSSVLLHLPSGEVISARVRRWSYPLDLAQLSPEQLITTPSLPWGDIPQLGSPVYAVGYPLPEDTVMSAGIWSGTHERRLGRRPPMVYALTDALVAVGHSGGPLLNSLGQVVGILTGGFNDTHEASGFGLAIPAPNVQAWLAREEPPESDSKLTLQPKDNALIVVVAEGEWAQLGLVEGQRFTGLGGGPIEDIDSIAPGSPWILGTTSEGEPYWLPFRAIAR